MWAKSTLTQVSPSPLATSSGATGNQDGVLGVLSSNGVTMVYLEEVGGANNDRLFDVEVYGDFLYWTGAVGSGFPASASGVYDASYNGGTTDAIIGRVRDNGLDYKATFYGTNTADLGNGIKQVTPTTCTGNESTTFLLVFGTVNGTGLPNCEYQW
ncbi:MAG: hypothetical protein IPH93_16065 [Saprospiraceae bacterium]|nr:hypothetical protein [Saprospiraceae bacterium]